VNPAGLRPSGLVVVLSCWSCPLPNPGGAEARTAVDLAPSSRLGGPCPFYPDGPPATRLHVKAHRPRPPCFHCSARTRMPWRRQRLVSSLLREPPPPRGAPSSTTSRRSVPASVTNWTRPPAPLTLTDPAGRLGTPCVLRRRRNDRACPAVQEKWWGRGSLSVTSGPDNTLQYAPAAPPERKTLYVVASVGGTAGKRVVLAIWPLQDRSWEPDPSHPDGCGKLVLPIDEPNPSTQQPRTARRASAYSLRT